MNKILYVIGGIVIGLVLSVPFLIFADWFNWGRGSIGTIVYIVSFYIIPLCIVTFFGYTGYKQFLNPNRYFKLFSIISVILLIILGIWKYWDWLVGYLDTFGR